MLHNFGNKLHDSHIYIKQLSVNTVDEIWEILFRTQNLY